MSDMSCHTSMRRVTGVCLKRAIKSWVYNQFDLQTILCLNGRGYVGEDETFSGGSSRHSKPRSLASHKVHSPDNFTRLAGVFLELFVVTDSLIATTTV